MFFQLLLIVVGLGAIPGNEGHKAGQSHTLLTVTGWHGCLVHPGLEIVILIVPNMCMYVTFTGVYPLWGVS